MKKNKIVSLSKKNIEKIHKKIKKDLLEDQSLFRMGKMSDYIGELYREKKDAHGCFEDPFIRDLSDIIGSEIINIGFCKSVEGGLSFDYIKNGIKKRVILGYTELGEWIEWQGNLN